MDVVQAFQAVEHIVDDVEKLNTVKNILLNTFVTHYQALQTFINQMPIPFNLKQIIQKEFDSGYLWGKEALHIMQLNIPKKEEQESAPAVDAIQVEEPKEEVVN